MFGFRVLGDRTIHEAGYLCRRRRRLSLRIVILIGFRRTILVRSSVDDRLEIKVTVAGRTWCHPFEGITVPRITADSFAKEYAVDKVPGEDNLRGNHRNCTPSHKLVHRQQMPERFVVIGIRQSSGKTDSSKNVHREEGAIQKDECQEEVNLPKRLIHHPPKHLWIPKIDRTPDRHRGPGEENVVEVSDDEVSIVNENINGSGRHKDPRQTTDDEHRDEGKGEQHGCRELYFTAPNGAQPIEHLHGTRQSDHHRRDHEGHAEHRIHS